MMKTLNLWRVDEIDEGLLRAHFVVAASAAEAAAIAGVRVPVRVVDGSVEARTMIPNHPLDYTLEDKWAESASPRVLHVFE